MEDVVSEPSEHLVGAASLTDDSLSDAIAQAEADDDDDRQGISLSTSSCFASLPVQAHESLEEKESEDKEGVAQEEARATSDCSACKDAEEDRSAECNPNTGVDVAEAASQQDSQQDIVNTCMNDDIPVVAREEEDDRIQRKIRRMERQERRSRTPPQNRCPAHSTPSPSTTRATHASASSEPGGGLILATAARTPPPQPSFKAAAPARSNDEPPRVGAVYCRHRPQPHPSSSQSQAPSQPQSTSNNNKSAWSAALTPPPTPQSNMNANFHIDNTPMDNSWFKSALSEQDDTLQQDGGDVTDVTTSATDHHDNTTAEHTVPHLSNRTPTEEQDDDQYNWNISAEVVPETQLDLERSIGERLRRDLVLSSSLRREILQDAPVALVVQLEDVANIAPSGPNSVVAEMGSTMGAGRATSEAGSSILRREKKPSKWLVLLLAALLLVVVAIILFVLAFTGVFTSSNNSASQSTSKALNDTSIATTNSDSLPLDDEPHQEYDDNFVLASIPETICYDRLPYMGFRSEKYVTSCPPQPSGSPVADFVAQSRLWNVAEADIAIVNGGEIKGDLFQGNFTYANFTTFMPYDNDLVLVALPGNRIMSLLERVLQTIVNDLGLAELSDDPLDGAYPYAAGLRYGVNMSKDFPHRVTNLEFNRRLNESSWTSLNLTATYTIVTNSYLKNGGDGYHELSAEPGVETGLGSQSAFMEYCLHHKVLLNPPEETYSTRSFYFVPGMYDSWNP